MKYPCNLIQDLIPLYLDGVCSNESSKIIEIHLNECAECKDFYMRICDADNVEQLSYNEKQELQKAHSFKAVKKE